MKASSQKYKWNNEVLYYEAQITIEAQRDGNLTSIIRYASTVVYTVWHCVKHCYMTHDRMAMMFVLRHYCFSYIVQPSSKEAHVWEYCGSRKIGGSMKKITTVKRKTQRLHAFLQICLVMLIPLGSLAILLISNTKYFIDHLY